MKRLWKFIVRKLTVYEVKNGNLRLIPIYEVLITRALLIFAGFIIAYAATIDQQEFQRSHEYDKKPNVRFQQQNGVYFNAR